MFFGGMQAVKAGESGVSHLLPGASATLIDLPPTNPGWYFKPMFFNYAGSASKVLPTAIGLVVNLDVTTSSLVLGGTHTFDQTILGGAHFSVGTFVPYAWIDISGDLATPVGDFSRSSKVSGFGDMTVLPVMLAWQTGNWQMDTELPVYIPTGSYVKGRFGNPSLNYWTFDPNVGLTYKNKKSGFNGTMRVGLSLNTENLTTHYQSGALLHLESAVEQILPVGAGLLTLGVEAFYFKQVTADSGSGAVLGAFKGLTTGLGPVVGYMHKVGKDVMLLELKWLTELDTKNRLEGDYLWAKAVYKF